jgi:hypothetical protein
MAVAKKLSNANTSKFQQILAASGQDLIERRSQLIYTGTNDAMQDHLTSLVRKEMQLSLKFLFNRSFC